MRLAMLRRCRIGIALAVALAVAAAADAQTRKAGNTKPVPATPAPAPVVADPALIAQANELIVVLNRGGDYDGYFADSFREKVDKAKFDTLSEQIEKSLGKAVVIETLTPASPFEADLRIGYERGVAIARIAVNPAEPHKVEGLLITGTEARDDSLAKLDADFAALPGMSGYGIYALGKGKPRTIAQRNADRPAPLGSAFKLWVLAEAARQTKAGMRRWSDVVPVGAPSLPSGILQTWPAGSPVTLQTLATLMISMSDNTATDTLMNALGRPRLDAIVATTGTNDPARTTPLLTTREAFQLKVDANADLARAWANAKPPARRKLMAANAARLAATPINSDMFGGKPVAIDTIEWFGSPHDEAMVLDWLRTKGGPTALAIMAVNPGMPKQAAAQLDYVGFKGGSEPGVITLNYLVRDKQGRWFAITSNWHRSDAGVDLITFTGLLSRAIALAGSR